MPAEVELRCSEPGSYQGDVGRFDLVASADRRAADAGVPCRATVRRPGPMAPRSFSTLTADDALLGVRCRRRSSGPAALDPSSLRSSAVARALPGATSPSKAIARCRRSGRCFRSACVPSPTRTIAALQHLPPQSLELARGRRRCRSRRAVSGRFDRARSGRHLGTVAGRSDARRTGPNADRDFAARGLSMTPMTANDSDGVVVDFLSSPVGGGGPIGRLLKRLMGDARSEGAGRRAPTRRRTAPGMVARPGRRWRSRHEARAADRGRRPSSGRGRPSTRSGTEHHRRYRADWCTVTETPPESDGQRPPLALPDLHGLRRALASLGSRARTAPPAAPGRRSRYRCSRPIPGRCRRRIGRR